MRRILFVAALSSMIVSAGLVIAQNSTEPVLHETKPAAQGVAVTNQAVAPITTLLHKSAASTNHAAVLAVAATSVVHAASAVVVPVSEKGPVAAPVAPTAPVTPAAVAAQPTTELATNVVPAVTVVPPLVLVEPAPPSAPAENKKFYNSFIKNRLEIGTRILHGSLLDDTRGQPFNGSFVGSVTMLRDNQDLLPTRFYVQYKILDYLGVGVSYDKISAAAGDWGIEGDGTGGSDGDVNLSGPLFYLLGCYPNSTKFTPFCEAGMGVYSAKFDADAAWGSTNDKRFELNSTKGIYFGAGCDFEVTDHFSVNAYGRYMKIDDVTGDYMLLGNKQSDIIFTMSYMAFGIGAKYAF